MKKETLFDAVGRVEDDLIDAAARPERRGHVRQWRRWTALAACLALVVTGIALFPRMGGNSSEAPNSGEPGEMYGGKYYDQGPILPLTARENADALSVSRDVTFDFENGASRAKISDCYTLCNETQEAVTVRLLYPFAGSLDKLDEQRPTVYLDGVQTDTGLYAAASDRSRLSGWEDYEALLSGKELPTAERADLSEVPVIVYRFDHVWGEAECDSIPNPTVRAEFTLDYEKTAVLSYGFHGARYDLEAGKGGRSFSIPKPSEPGYEEPRYLIVLGEDIGQLTTQGYATGGWETTETIEYGVDITRYETDLDTALSEVFDLMYRDMSGTADERELWYSLYCDDLALSVGQWMQWEGVLEGTYFDNVQRVFYLETEVTIPADGAVTLQFTMEKEGGHYAYRNSRSACYRYELATALGSELRITHQTARLVNTQSIRVETQDFGFDPEAGVTEAELDPGVGRYRLEATER